jgi:hypothetical protein
MNKSHKNLKFPFPIRGLFCLKLNFLMFSIGCILPVNASTQTGVFNIIQSEENVEEWTGINKRLQAVSVKYCVIPLANINNLEDVGKQQVLFLPNVEKLTPVQAMVLKKWIYPAWLKTLVNSYLKLSTTQGVNPAANCAIAIINPLLVYLSSL